MFQTKTVDSILGSFHKNIRDLNELAAKNTQEAESVEETARIFLDKAKSLRGESSRASGIASKISSLIS
jgi:hypothetical protein